MKLFKKCLVLFTAAAAFASMGSICSAEILPAHGPGQIGYSSVILCDSITLRKDPSASSEVVKTLNYGDKIIVMKQSDGWAQCALTDDVDGGPEGWVNAEYIAIDPAWYHTDDTTIVYAYNDLSAPKVGQISKDTTLAILKDEGDWVVVSLRGASGWIHKTDADIASADAN